MNSFSPNISIYNLAILQFKIGLLLLVRTKFSDVDLPFLFYKLTLYL